MEGSNSFKRKKTDDKEEDKYHEEKEQEEREPEFEIGKLRNIHY
jgi:hypothetical protein